MKKILPVFVVLSFLLLLTGCPYNSKVPLTETSKIPIDKALLGIWKTYEDDSSEAKIFEFNKTEYYIEIKDITNGKPELTRYRAYISKVGTYNLINIENLKYKGDYNFFRYKIEGNELRVETVSDVLITGVYKDSKNLMNAFIKEINKKDFFESEIKFKRK
jgi:hypothetical protein